MMSQHDDLEIANEFPITSEEVTSKNLFLIAMVFSISICLGMPNAFKISEPFAQNKELASIQMQIIETEELLESASQTLLAGQAKNNIREISHLNSSALE